MHVTGKILIVILIGTAVYAFICAGQLVQVRGKRMNRVQDVKARNEKTADVLIAARAAFEEARADLQRENLRWDRNWTDVSASFLSGNNSLIAKVGFAAGIPASSTLYAFELAASGPIYVGASTSARCRPIRPC